MQHDQPLVDMSPCQLHCSHGVLSGQLIMVCCAHFTQLNDYGIMLRLLPFLLAAMSHMLAQAL